MTESTIDLPTADGAMATRTFVPEGGPPFPVVLFYMDGLGVREALVGMARRIAAEGYAVVLPNLFHRSGPYAPFHGPTAFGDAAERERLLALIKEVTPARALADTAAVMDWIGAQPAFARAKVGTVGYCMGGGPALAAAGAFPDRVAAAASYHGGRLATEAPDSPHVLAARAKGRLYIGYAENDASFPEGQRQRLEEALRTAGVTYTMELYHAAHGFAVPDLPPYDREAAERHWRTLLDLFAATLR